MAVSKMSLREGEEQQSVDRYKKVIMDLQEHVVVEYCREVMVG